MIKCPLCLNKTSLTPIKNVSKRAFKRCGNCCLIFTEPDYLPSETSEKKRYLSHNNSLEQVGYVNFLNSAIEPALPFLKPNMQGLDFGCGPSPGLSVILKQKGLSCDNYDPYFFPSLPAKKFDFIFATETFEHFFYPAKEIARIKKLLNPSGLLIIMTETWVNEEQFTEWYYARDFTHVSFYHIKTFDFIAQKFGFNIIKKKNNRIVIMQHL